MYLKTRKMSISCYSFVWIKHWARWWKLEKNLPPRKLDTSCCKSFQLSNTCIIIESSTEIWKWATFLLMKTWILKSEILVWLLNYNSLMRRKGPCVEHLTTLHLKLSREPLGTPMKLISGPQVLSATHWCLESHPSKQIKLKWPIRKLSPVIIPFQ